MFFFNDKRISKRPFERGRVFLDDPFYLFSWEKKFSNCHFFIVCREKEYVERFSAFGFHSKRCCRSHLDCKHFGRAPGLSSAWSHGLWPAICDCSISGQLARPLARYPRLHAFWSIFLRDANPDCRQRRQPVRQPRRPSACAARLQRPVRPAI